MRRLIFLVLPFFLLACGVQTPVLETDVTRERIDIYVDAFSEGWLPAFYDCAERSPVWLLARTPSADSANVVVGINGSLMPAVVPYPLGEIEFLPVINAQNPLGLSVDDIQAIYAGRVYNWAQLGWDDAPIQAWAYPSEMGVNGRLLGTDKLSSLVYQAQSPAAMRDAIQQDIYAIGFLPRADVLPSDSIRPVSLDVEFSFPVLAMVPQGETNALSLLACLN